MRAWPILLLLGRVASADVEAEVGASADADRDGAYAAATADASAVQLWSKSYAGCYGSICAFASGDPDDRELVRADAAGTVTSRTAYGDARATGRFAGWQVALDVAWQPLGSLHDSFWRSGRGIVQTELSFEIPPFVTSFVGDDGSRVEVAPVAIAIDRWDGGDVRDEDADVKTVAIRYVAGASHVSVFAIHTIEHDRGGDSADALAADIVDVASHGVHVWAGVDELEVFGNVHPVDAFRWGGELEHAVGPVTASAGLGSWARLDPAGDGADLGQLASGSIAWQHGRWGAHGTVDAGRLVRRLGTPAPTRWMGRGELGGDLALSHAIALVGDAWVERSDRDDPRWAAPATPGAVADHAGVELAARWKIKNWVAGAATQR